MRHNQWKSVQSPTKGCTTYMTIPLSKRCVSALAKASISKIVTRIQYSDILVKVAKRENIELVSVLSYDSLLIKK